MQSLLTSQGADEFREAGCRASLILPIYLSGVFAALDSSLRAMPFCSRKASKYFITVVLQLP
jgi:hypothetical protein